MKIYVASSWRNVHQAVVVRVLRAAGHEVYDFKNPAPGNSGFSWRQTETPNYKHGDLVDAYTWRKMVDHPVAIDGFEHDFGAMKWCDVCVFVLPAGRSASFEIGWCMGQGKRGVVLALEPVEPELMFREAAIVGSLADLLDAL